MESEAELIQKWEGILAAHDANEQKCRKREEAIHVIDQTVGYIEVGVDRQECRIDALLDMGLDTLSRAMKINHMGSLLGIEIEQP